MRNIYPLGLRKHSMLGLYYVSSDLVIVEAMRAPALHNDAGASHQCGRYGGLFCLSSERFPATIMLAAVV